MKKKIFIVAAAFLCSQLQAKLNAQQQDEDTTDLALAEVTLTASKYPKKQSETGKVVSVISRQELDRSSGKTLGELLNTAVGTTVLGANNNPGTNQTISLRGSSSGNVLVLVDGIPVNDPSVNTNYFDLNLFSIDLIERIEILKGGQSTLYGSDAVAGVINIITRKSESKPFNMRSGITGGSYNTFKEFVGLSGRTSKINYSINYTHLASDGFSAAYDSSGKKNFDDDGIDRHSAGGDLGIKLSNHLELKFFGQYNYYKTDLDASAFTDEKDYTVKNENVIGGLGLTFNHNKGSLHYNYVFNYVDRDYLDDSIFKSSPYVNYSKSRYIGRTHFTEIYNNWKWDSWELLAGVDYRVNNTNQRYFSSGPFGPYSPPKLKANMSQFSPYASVIYKTGATGFTVEAGGRWNKHSDYGSNFTYTLNPSYLVNPNVKLFVNLYSAFKAPTLYQLFDPSAGNANLDPETSTSEEAGLDLFESRSFRFRAVGFYRNTKNAIQYILINPSTFQSQYRNISHQKNYGLELEIGYKVSDWNFEANYTYTDGKTRSPYDGTGGPLGKDTTYYNLYRIPKHALNVTIGAQATKALFISTHLRTVSKREEFIYGRKPVKLDNYYTLDLYGEYRFAQRWKMFIDLKNITDQKYFDFLGYNSKAFNFNAGISVSL